MILTCIVTYNRLAYTQRCVGSLLATARPEDRLIVVDNASSDGTQEWLLSLRLPVLINESNAYPGAACNRGWDTGLIFKPDLLHRSDNDIEYLPGWQAEVERAFATNALSLLGVLNLHEDRGEPDPPEGVDIVESVGGNVVIRADHFRAGMRWSEKPWGVGSAEDGNMSEQAHARGSVGRLRKTVANNMAFGRYADFPDYYDATALVRGIADPVHSV